MRIEDAQKARAAKDRTSSAILPRLTLEDQVVAAGRGFPPDDVRRWLPAPHDTLAAHELAREVLVANERNAVGYNDRTPLITA